ncbi:helix-turn-helix domain-containing protein [Cohnella faecalis]|uniref:AraC family transcriptional regulator n=1 Tax=Cohnella faecalis TaxID=2315694 RepID=A0A398CQ69_9BACL|nr:helix-turn-helix domain-containing protein [Cohnella faecalis]RIE01124.1 AraC family transcriptional regulator [Cohnella faecalis]
MKMDTAYAVQQAIDYMEERIGERLEPERIAEAAYMSLPNLYRAFYALTGHPLMEYIRKRRVSQAAIQLRHFGDSVMDTALDCGFESYRTFAAVFKKTTGMTPGAYRKAQTYYSFERVNLAERIDYSEDRELSSRYPDVKVVRVGPVDVVSYRHVSSAREGLAEEAFAIFYKMLWEAGVNMNKIRLFGSDVPDSGSQPNTHEYVMMAPVRDAFTFAHPKASVIRLPGGLYALSKAPPGPAASITAAWNRVLAEWLPRSAFKLGDHPFMEEFQHLRGKVARLKLFLPVMRKKEHEAIGIAELSPVRVLAFRSEGKDAEAKVDERMSAWLTGRAGLGDSGTSIYMSCSYGISEEADSWYELALSVVDDMDLSVEDRGRISWLAGGLYAHMTTGAYGAMTGVLDLLHAWVCRNGEYRLDDQRQWFAKYVAGDDGDLDRSTMVVCYVPVLER